MSRIAHYAIISALVPAASTRIITITITIIIMLMGIHTITGMTIITIPIRMPSIRWDRNLFAIANRVASKSG